MSSLWQPQLLEALLAEPQQRRAQQAVGYATLMVVRHCALALLHHGIRVAQLYLKAMVQQMPKVAPACQQALAALAAAQQKVDAGQLDDHPKHRRLQQLLTSLDVMYPVGSRMASGGP
jgi:hypothetical protein